MNTAMRAAGSVAGNPAPATAPDALAPPAGAAGADTPAPAPATPPAAALPFGHWIAREQALPETAAAPQGDTVTTPDADAGDAKAAPEEAHAPDVLLAAMAPLVAPAALPAMMLAMQGAKPGVAGDGAAAPSDDGVGQAGGARATPAAANVLTAAAAPILPSAVQAAGMPAAATGPGPGDAQPVTAQSNAMPAAAPVSGEAAAEASAEVASVTTAPGVSAAPPAGARGADSIVLAGPPTAWRQNLHEALGERLQLQLGRNIDQATIRLEPPMLGRIDIAIRHSGGNLEIHIAASNSDVLRQLNAVSDSLRSDLAGRQYSSVSVNVSDVPRMQASAQTGGQTPGQGQADAQGRSRQEQEQARTPGRALHDETAAGATLFSMN
ncbi:flagellar hook-length control protein FliK [Oxalobacteraceae sp. CFBP 13708]|nr:flagellar hook-length control protein FliK [Oxalobacteraceae sp. CFBP 13708]